MSLGMGGAIARGRTRHLVFWLDDAGLIASSADSWRHFLALIGPALGREVDIRAFTGAPPEIGDFAFVGDSAALTRTLCLSVDNIYLQPQAAPTQVDPFFASPWATDELVKLDLQPIQPEVSLITSVFDGDEFISGFLANCSRLHDYPAIQHWLIRAASPGQETDALIQHVRRCPQAVWINLSTDPGLYAVWNLGCRLATGRFLSNANIDDRRAPEHVAFLRGGLKRYPEVDVASAALRVSRQRNLDWHNASDCSLMFAEGEDRIYGVADLFQTTASGLASRNLPHCMPLWRRSLHARVGEFNERMFGPSADWAFWLQAGDSGALFHHSVKPLGLYLRDAGTYWRRSDDGRQADSRILAGWGHLGGKSENLEQARAQLFSPILLRLPTLFGSGACLIGLGQLLFAASLAERQKNVSTVLLARLADRYLGISDVKAWAAEAGNLKGSAYSSETVLFNALVGALNRFDPLSLGARAKVVGKNLSLASLDWQGVGDALQALILMALLAHQQGDSIREASLLKSAHARDRVSFWATVQRVYRFTRPLPALSALVGDLPEAVLPASSASLTRVFCYPRYTFNLYLTLLYAPLKAAGGGVEGTRDINQFLSVDPSPGHENILHVHWVSPLFEGNVTPENIQIRAAEFLSGLRRQKSRGFKVFWTIHNRLSHECVSPEAELAFRRELYELADQVFVHHPMAVGLLDWLPDRRKLQIYEHGAYPTEAAGVPANEVQESARSELGWEQEDFILIHIGQLRAYKDLGRLLPELAAWLERSPRAKFVIAGSIGDPEVKAWLSAHRHPQIIIREGFLREADLALHMRAADIGLLAYDEVLTSGTLIHWFSEGRPVLAPPKGTIPAYLVPGWNGFFYQSVDALGRALDYLYHAESENCDRLAQNAVVTARYLEWKPWKY
jgi:glycosyltransferase involved in cell wall biosynthesis